MDKNLPAGARANFKAALKDAGSPRRREISAEQKTAVSDALGELFRTSCVVAFDNAKHHVIAFWGEGGRTRALEQADAAIEAGGDATWSVAQWRRHRERMAARVSRYTKTRRTSTRRSRGRTSSRTCRWARSRSRRPRRRPRLAGRG